MKLVLLPGLDGTGRLFGPFLQALPADLSPVIISYPTDQSLSYPELVQFVSERLPSAEEFVLLAESFSGPVAVQIGARQAENLKALILSTTFVSSPTLVPQIMSFLLGGPVFILGPPQFIITRYLLGEKPPDESVKTFGQATRSVRADVLASRMRSVVNVDVRRAFEECRLPILYLHAKRDRLIKARSLAQMRKIRPEMTIVEIEGPHLLLQREPAKCVEAIADYLRTK